MYSFLPKSIEFSNCALSPWQQIIATTCILSWKLLPWWPLPWNDSNNYHSNFYHCNYECIYHHRNNYHNNNHHNNIAIYISHVHLHKYISHVYLQRWYDMYQHIYINKVLLYLRVVLKINIYYFLRSCLHYMWCYLLLTYHTNYHTIVCVFRYIIIV